jgi:protein-disulfide isomerase
MTDCKYCDEEFDSKEELHIHWGEEHEDELSSHDKEKVKKAEKKMKDKKSEKMRRRKKLGGQALAIGGALLVVAVLGYQAYSSMNVGGTTGEFDLEDEPFQGNADANVTVVEFGDYSCGHCQTFEAGAHQQLEENYISTGDVKFYWINYAFLGPQSTDAAVASECVHDQTGSNEEFWDFHSEMFDYQSDSNWGSTDLFVQIAEDATQNVNSEELRSCISSQETIDEVQSDRAQGSSNGVTGTPSIFVNGERIPNNEYSSIRAAIEQKLN